MNERDSIALMLILAGFVGASFWPVLCGWVDLGTLAGWTELVATYGLCILTVLAFSVVGIAGYLVAGVVRWLMAALTSRRSPGRARLYWVANGGWKLVWWMQWYLRRFRPVRETES